MKAITLGRNSRFIASIVLYVVCFPSGSAADHLLGTRVEGGGSSGNSYGATFENVSINRIKSSTTETSLTDNQSVAYGPHGGVGATARYGRLSASVSAFGTYDVRSQPYLYSNFIGTSIIDFSDELTIQSNGSVLPQSIEMKTTWSLDGALIYIVPDHGSNSPQGSLWTGDVSYSCNLGVGNAITGRTYRGRFDDFPVSDGEHLPLTIVKQAGKSAPGKFLLKANLQAQALPLYRSSSSDAFGIPLSTGVTRGSSFVNLKLLSIEFVNSSTDELLSVSVTSSSGHVYPVAQPPKTGRDGEVTAFTVNRDTKDVFLSFATEEGGSYCVQGGNTLGAWEDLTTLSGSNRISIVNVVDPPQETSLSRFYRVIRLAE